MMGGDLMPGIGIVSPSCAVTSLSSPPLSEGGEEEVTHHRKPRRTKYGDKVESETGWFI